MVHDLILIDDSVSQSESLSEVSDDDDDWELIEELEEFLGILSSRLCLC